MTSLWAARWRRLQAACAAALPLIDRYIETAALRACLLVAAALTALFSLFEFVDQLASVGQGHYRLADDLVYVLLTAPSRLLQVMPVSMLLGSLFALGALGRNSELTAMRSLGISETRIIGAIVKIAVPLIVILFLLAEFVVPPAQQLAQTQRNAALASSSSSASPGNDGFWAQSNHQYLNVEQFAYGNIQNNIDIYSFADDGTLQSVIHADHAVIQPDGTWLLTNVSEKTISAAQFQTQHLASLSWRSFLSHQQLELLMLPPESMPPIALYRYIHDPRQPHQQAVRYEQALWAKLSIPLSMIAMIMIAAPFVFDPPRAQSTGQQIMIGAIVGIIFSLSQQIAGYLSLLLDLSPALTAITPSLLLMALSIHLFRRAHR